jgi:RNA polymerase-binding transcription factor DksA
MPTQRKSGSKAAKPKKKTAAASGRPTRGAKAGAKAKPSSRPERRVVGRPIPKSKTPAAAPASDKGRAKPVTAKAAPAKVSVVAKGTASKKDGKAPVTGRKPVIKVVTQQSTAPVRPLGVLPPEAVARATHRSPAALPERPTRKPARQTIQTQGAQGVTANDFKEFEQRLLDERQKILKEMGHLENTVLKINQRDSAGDLSGYSFHMADVGTDAMEREKAFLFASAEGRQLLEINEALRRVYRGEYGTCETCGQPIARARLEAVPYARLCVSCKEKEERASRGAS